jgi:hypothetical protein
VTITHNGSATIDGWNLGFVVPGYQKTACAWNRTAPQSAENITVNGAARG